MFQCDVLQFIKSGKNLDSVVINAFGEVTRSPSTADKVSVYDHTPYIHSQGFFYIYIYIIIIKRERIKKREEKRICSPLGRDPKSRWNQHGVGLRTLRAYNTLYTFMMQTWSEHYAHVLLAYINSANFGTPPLGLALLGMKIYAQGKMTIRIR